MTELDDSPQRSEWNPSFRGDGFLVFIVPREGWGTRCVLLLKAPDDDKLVVTSRGQEIALKGRGKKRRLFSLSLIFCCPNSRREQLKLNNYFTDIFRADIDKIADVTPKIK